MNNYLKCKAHKGVGQFCLVNMSQAVRLDVFEKLDNGDVRVNVCYDEGHIEYVTTHRDLNIWLTGDESGELVSSNIAKAVRQFAEFGIGTY